MHSYVFLLSSLYYLDLARIVDRDALSRFQLYHFYLALAALVFSYFLNVSRNFVHTRIVSVLIRVLEVKISSNFLELIFSPVFLIP